LKETNSEGHDNHSRRDSEVFPATAKKMAFS